MSRSDFHFGDADRMRAAGVLLVNCDLEGIDVVGPRPSDWLEVFCLHNPVFRRAISDALAAWAAERAPQTINPFPGLHLAPLPILKRRRCVAYNIAIILSEEILESQRLAAVCEAADLDPAVVYPQLKSLPPVAASEVSRVIQLLGIAHETRLSIDSERQSAESVGKQLAESYEEISLLYTITQSMTDVQQPDRFVTIACEELLGTLPYRWIGAQFRDDLPWLKRLAGKIIHVGAMPTPEAEMSELLARLMKDAAVDAPIIIEPQTNGGKSADDVDGQVLLAQPVVRDGQIVGLLIAGDKQGDDAAASSVDMKLLGATATHLAIFLENAALYDDLNAMFLGTLEALTASIDAKDRYTCGHSLRVAHLTQQLARAAGVDEETAGRMRIAGLVHDVGKIGVPEAVLTKPGRLTDEEFGWIKRHPEMGYRILRDIPQLMDILPGVLHHHERWDGRGYPSGLEGTDIPLVARIITLADAFDAMSSTRTYRAAMLRSDVLREIENVAGKQFDVDLAALFVKLDFSEFDRLVEEHRAAMQSADKELAA